MSTEVRSESFFENLKRRCLRTAFCSYFILNITRRIPRSILGAFTTTICIIILLSALTKQRLFFTYVSDSESDQGTAQHGYKQIIRNYISQKNSDTHCYKNYSGLPASRPAFSASVIPPQRQPLPTYQIR